MEPALIVIRWLHFTSVMLAFGLLAFCEYQHANLSAGSAPLRLARAPRISAVVGLGTGLCWLLLESALMNDSWKAVVDWSMLHDVIFETDFGINWCCHLGFGLLLSAALIFKTPRGLAVILAACFLASLAFIGHAVMQTGAAGWGHRVNQVVHLLSAGAWIGGLVALQLTLWPAKNSTAPTPMFVRDVLLRFSGVGYYAVAGVVATGAVNSWFMIGKLKQLFTIDYGITLLVKIALVVVMIILAAINRFILLPRATDMHGIRDLKNNILVEQILGFFILATVSVLGTLPPGGS